MEAAPYKYVVRYLPSPLQQYKRNIFHWSISVAHPDVTRSTHAYNAYAALHPVIKVANLLLADHISIFN